MKSWAYAVSPHGLGLSEERSWELTPREFHALQDVHTTALYRWAMQQASFYNAHFRGKGEPAYEPEHFLGTKTRKVMSVKEKLEVQRVNLALEKITEDDVPDWAKGPKEQLCPATQ